MDVTKEEYEAYEAVRQSGVTNMFDERTVAALRRTAATRSPLRPDSYSEARERWGLDG